LTGSWALYLEASLVAGTGVQGAVVDRHSLAHPDEPVAGFRVTGHATAVIGDCDVEALPVRAMVMCTVLAWACLRTLVSASWTIR
jgi:hypothetical protein